MTTDRERRQGSPPSSTDYLPPPKGFIEQRRVKTSITGLTKSGDGGGGITNLPLISSTG